MDPCPVVRFRPFPSDLRRGSLDLIDQQLLPESFDRRGNNKLGWHVA